MTPRPAREPRALRLGIVASEFNRDITDRMLAAARKEAALGGHRVVVELRVPGVFEIPLAAATLLGRRDVDAVVTLGAVIRGETDHDRLITAPVAQALTELSLSHRKPVALGITGPGQTHAQAVERIDRGAAAVRAAVAMVGLLRAASG